MSGYIVDMRVVGAIALIVLGCGAAFIAWGPLSNLFGYRDSAVSTYLVIGLPFVALAVVAFVAAWRLLAR